MRCCSSSTQAKDAPWPSHCLQPDTSWRSWCSTCRCPSLGATYRSLATFVWPAALGWVSARTSAPSPGVCLLVQWPQGPCMRADPACAVRSAGTPPRAMSVTAHPPSPHISPPPHLRRSWANLFNSDALTKLVPTLLSCFAMIATLEHFSHPLALPTGAAGAECSWQCCNPTTRLCSAGRNPGHGHM